MHSWFRFPYSFISDSIYESTKSSRLFSIQWHTKNKQRNTRRRNNRQTPPDTEGLNAKKRTEGNNVPASFPQNEDQISAEKRRVTVEKKGQAYHHTHTHPDKEEIPQKKEAALRKGKRVTFFLEVYRRRWQYEKQRRGWQKKRGRILLRHCIKKFNLIILAKWFAYFMDA